MNIIILDDYQDAVRKLPCASKLDGLSAKVFTNTVKGVGQLAVRLRDAEALVLIRERTHFPKALLEKLPKLRLISQTGPVGAHIDLEACTRLGIAVAETPSDPVSTAELTWAHIMSAMRRLPQYIGNLKHGAWQQSGLKAASMPPNFERSQRPSTSAMCAWGMLRACASMSAMACSAADTALDPAALTTTSASVLVSPTTSATLSVNCTAANSLAKVARTASSTTATTRGR